MSSIVPKFNPLTWHNGGGGWLPCLKEGEGQKQFVRGEEKGGGIKLRNICDTFEFYGVLQYLWLIIDTNLSHFTKNWTFVVFHSFVDTRMPPDCPTGRLFRFFSVIWLAQYIDSVYINYQYQVELKIYTSHPNLFIF